jgi:hypothetical protein
MNFLRRIPLLPTLISIAVLVTAGVPTSPIRDAATGGSITEAYIERSLGYVAIAPLSDVLDTLTLLSARQHIALLGGVLVLFVVWRAFRATRGATLRNHGVALRNMLGAIVVTYAAAAALPRPMAALRSDNANILKVDFHSHTSASHDGYQDVDALRDWHRAAGFDAAFITDHAAVSAAERAVLANPSHAAEGITLFQGIETGWNGEHVTILGAQRAYTGLLTEGLTNVDTQSLRLASFIPGREPIVIWNHPRDLSRLTPAGAEQYWGIRAVEVVNGAPKDIDVLRKNRSEIVGMARLRDIALTAGSDNHGIGRAAPGWTMLVIIGWRGAPPDALAIEIDKAIREGKFAATKIVERVVADPGQSQVRLAMSVLTVPFVMLTTIDGDERLSWLVWTWAIFAAMTVIRRRRATPA